MLCAIWDKTPETTISIFLLVHNWMSNKFPCNCIKISSYCSTNSIVTYICHWVITFHAIFIFLAFFFTKSFFATMLESFLLHDASSITIRIYRQLSRGRGNSMQRRFITSSWLKFEAWHSLVGCMLMVLQWPIALEVDVFESLIEQ